MNARTVAALFVLALHFVFILMNLEKANVWLFGIRAEMPIALVVFVSGALGMVAGLLLAFVRKAGRKKDSKPTS